MKRLVFLLLIAVFCFPGYSQTENTPEEYLDDGYFFFQTEDYSEALFNFLQLKGTNLMNDNIKYKIGLCYLNIAGEEYNGIPYLEEASQNTTLKYKSKSIKEKQAPWHSFFYLGKAYRINNQLDKALEAYTTFRNLPDFEDNYNLSLVDNEISSCGKAKIIQDIPVKIIETNLGEPINNSSANYNPVISQDENTIVFMTDLKFYNAIYQSKKINGQWTEPENITPQVGSDGDAVPTSLSYDGKELFLVKGSNNNRDIYISKFKDGWWTNMELLGENINSNHAETHASVSSDGNTLYFTSNKRGGLGGLDIYSSKKMKNGQWGPAENLGPKINTIYNEETPFLAADEQTLYFSSEGHYNMGGFDIFYSELKENGKWDNPTNIGYPVNTTSDNIFYNPVGAGYIGYVSKISRDGLGNKDLYRIKIISDEDKTYSEFHGPVDMNGKIIKIDKNFNIRIIDKFTNKVIATIYFNKIEGKFTYMTESGNYYFKYEE